jgi:F0F1-type ATP synthase membrane subunit c/vacuolar-type H+-ATPase subunit K
MNAKQEKKRRKLTREKYKEAINSVASSALRREIWRLARTRDLIGILAIIEGIAIIALVIFIVLSGQNGL